MSRRKKKKEAVKFDRVESVGIKILLRDGHSREYPLELWQVEVLTEMLGFQVKISDLDDYKFLDKDIVSAKMDVFHKAESELQLDSWTEYWDKYGEKE